MVTRLTIPLHPKYRPDIDGLRALKEVYFLGNWDKLNDLPMVLKGAKRKPDIIVIVRVERSF